MAAGIRATSSRLLGSVLAAAGSVLVMASWAPAVSADDQASAQLGPTISVSPSSGLSNGQTVTITGSGFTANSSIGVSMCDDPLVDRSSCDHATAKIARSDGAGSFTLAYAVADSIHGHSCVPTGCLIGAANLDVHDETADQISLGFAAVSDPTRDGPPAPVSGVGGSAHQAPAAEVATSHVRAGGSGVAALATPTISVSPSSGLSNGQTVSITGSGFTANSSIGVSMCDDPFVDGSSCDFATAKIGRSDGSGGFTLSYAVVDKIKGHTCVPTGCLIGAANLNVDNEFANRVSLRFGAGSTSTTAPGSSSPGSSAPGSSAPGSSAPGSATSPGTPAGGATAAGSTTTALATTGVSDSLASLTVGGCALMAAGAALLIAARRAGRWRPAR